MNRVPLEVSVHWRYLHQDMRLTWKQIHDMKGRGYQKYSKATICRHMKKPFNDLVNDKRKQNKGRPKKLTDRDRRNILRQVNVLRGRNIVNFTVKKIKEMAGLSHRNICDESIRLVLIKAGFAYRNAARKGVLIKKDLIKRREFAERIKRILANNGREFWKTGISFYLDGVSFTHKFNPLGQAQCAKKKIWRRKSERLKFRLTTKSNNIGVGGRRAHYLVGIGHNKGVVFCEQYTGRINGEKFADFVRTTLPEAFSNSANPKGKIFLQDGDPSQNSKVAMDAILEIGARVFSIPPRSPDLNPIENIFNVTKEKLKEDALMNEITKEDWDSFCMRVKSTLENTDIAYINSTIESMERRVDLVIANGGERTKY